MPKPIDLLLGPAAWAVFAINGALLAWEGWRPARALPFEPFWRLRGFASFALYFLLASYLTLLIDGHLAAWQLFDLTGLGTWGGAAVGFVVAEIGIYFWHRALHGSGLLWRAAHQWHHGAERIDAAGAFWFSPLDMIGWTLVSSSSLVLLVGLTPHAATLVMLATTGLAIYRHANVRSPRWTGYLIQRPEQHRVHHERGLHADNYCDLSVIDMRFGTLRNPAEHEAPTGFFDGASRRIGQLLPARDLAAAAPDADEQRALLPLGLSRE